MKFLVQNWSKILKYYFHLNIIIIIIRAFLCTTWSSFLILLNIILMRSMQNEGIQKFSDVLGSWQSGHALLVACQRILDMVWLAQWIQIMKNHHFCYQHSHDFIFIKRILLKLIRKFKTLGSILRMYDSFKNWLWNIKCLEKGRLMNLTEIF